MTDPILTILTDAAGRFQAGDFSAALAGALDALAKAPGHPEALHIKALALGRLGRIDEAAPAYEAAARAHPQKHAVLSNFANALSAAGRTKDAIAVYRQALAAEPRFVNGWFNLASALKESGDLGGSIDALTKAVALDPRNAKAQNNLGSSLGAAGRQDDELAAYGAALAADPDYPPSLINRGRLLRERGEIGLAIADLARATLAAPDAAEAHYQLACALRLAAEIDRAAASYRRAIALFPHSTAAHRDLANMLFEADRAGEFLQTLDEVIAQAPTAALLDLRAELSIPAGDVAGAEAAAERLIALDPADLRGFLRLARLRRLERRFAEAVQSAACAVAAAPGDFRARHEYAEALMANRQPAEAVRILGEEAPPEHLQKHIALLSIALRAAGDPAYRRYYDYDRFTAKIFIDAPDGFADVAAFNAALLAALLPLHDRSRQRPIDQTLYGGTQSFGSLWDEPHPVIQKLKFALMTAAHRYVWALPDDPAHPFLARKTQDLACAGSWSVMLKSGGGHVDHFHPKGWISASYYVKVPEEVALGEKAGFIRLGASGVDGLALPAERWIRPEEGAVVFFPSYIWHGVEPFSAASPRVTAPFDLAPR